MGKLTAMGITSLDGYIADSSGNFDWSAPDEEVHGFVNDTVRSTGTYLLGRRTYETLTYWETADDPGEPAVHRDFAKIWHAADKIVYSTTLPEVTTARTRLERSFDPEAIRALKEAAVQDISIDGPNLAAQAARAGLIDEYHQFISPVMVGGGTRYLPDGQRRQLELLDQRRFGNGVVYLHYRVIG
ncbi:dihydrofolate reductase family protein [Antrihabitans sp. YC2-6]|uniref:dihydrofolate reductase family protein n=1 Tax=Antrihabitans sp. YC2-6 TaxID=2799498 RepID=UPI0018F556A3|nr:dihydrofolate reductase family protein [Antrihabitans sp. YC2-6]MBJ8345451.1 dihydrofolate reductase family protein [Antrihabitans sp. YC2-6]